MAVKDKIQLGFIFAAILFYFIHDECGISLGPVANGFINPAKGLSVDEFDTNVIPVFLDQFTDPVVEKEIFFPHILWIFAEVFFVPFFYQTHLI